MRKNPNILLLEPNYRAKYPPLGLMKIAYYHKQILQHKNVYFAKGTIENPKALKVKRWDRVYVSTMFTFEWNETIKAINYAKQLVENDSAKIFIGGIAATLMPDEFEKETGIRPFVGLLNKPGVLGYNDEVIIDTLPPDYSILEQITYKYPSANAYFAYATRGCGQNCSFCAVKTLEPVFEDRVHLSYQIEAIRQIDGASDDVGEVRHNLLLLDNNVLRSNQFKDIVDELIALGFEKGATCRNKRTGKTLKRYVDFNQGLDAYLMTEKKATLLGKLAIKPARIAFDHIEDEAAYSRAVRRCVDVGIREFSNYVLYNADQTHGKGKVYPADTPEDLYKRLRTNIDLVEEFNRSRESDNRVFIYSFPMKYIPLNHKSRDYIGPNWNKKALRTIQVMLTPTQGKGVSSKGFFEAAFGKDIDEFKRCLVMPEEILSLRGHYQTRKNESNFQASIRHKQKVIQKAIWMKWEELYDSLTIKDELAAIINDNTFAVDMFFNIQTDELKKIYLYYLSNTQRLELFKAIDLKEDYQLLRNHFLNDCPEFLDYLSLHAVLKKTPYTQLIGFYRMFGYRGLASLINNWIDANAPGEHFINNIHNLFIDQRKYDFNIDYLKVIQLYSELGCLSKEDAISLKEAISDGNQQNVKRILSTVFVNLEEQGTDNPEISDLNTKLTPELLHTIGEALSNKLFE